MSLFCWVTRKKSFVDEKKKKKENAQQTAREYSYVRENGE